MEFNPLINGQIDFTHVMLNYRAQQWDVVGSFVSVRPTWFFGAIGLGH